MDTSEVLGLLESYGIRDTGLIVIDGIKYVGLEYKSHLAKTIELMIFYNDTDGVTVEEVYYFHNDTMYALNMMSSGNTEDDYKNNLLILLVNRIDDVDTGLVNGDKMVIRKVKQLLVKSSEIMSTYFSAMFDIIYDTR